MKEFVLSAVSSLVLFGAAAAEPTGCPAFAVDPPRPRPGAVLRAADYGFSVTNTDNAAALQRAVDAARKSNAAAIELPAGRFPCFGPGGVVLDGFCDFTLRGRGTVFVFRRTPSNGQPNFRIVRCTRVLVEDLVTDWDWDREPLASFATVAATHVDSADDGSYVDFDLRVPHPAYPAPVPLLNGSAVTSDFSGFRAGGGSFDCGTWFGHFGSCNTWLSPRRLRVWPAVRAPGQRQYAPQLALFSPERNRAFAKRFTVGEAVRLLHFYYGENAFELDSNAHLTLRRVHVRACRSIGFLVKGTQHHWRMESCSIAPEDGSGRAVSSTADACHVVKSRGFCQLVDCRWRLNEDDMNNFHDRTTLAVKHGPRGLEVVNSCGSGYLGAAPGDELELLHADYAPTGWRGRLVSVKGNVCEMDRETPAETNFAFVVANRSYGTDNILLRNCTFESSGLRNLIHGSNVTIENCTWKGTAASPVRFQAAWTPDNWCEGAGCSNLVVRNCRFARDNLHRWKVAGRTAEIVSVALTPEKTWCAPKTRTPALVRAIRARFPDGTIRVTPWAGVVSDLLVENCTFVDPIQYTAQFETGRNLTFRHNRTILTSRAADDPPDRGTVFVGARTENVRLEDNRREEILFNGRDLSGWYTYLKGRGRNADPNGVFTVTNGVLRVSGREFGALVTEREFSDYRLTLDYRFPGGEQMSWKRGKAPDSGLLFHSTGADGAFGGMWMESIEANLIKGATGDFWGVSPTKTDRVRISARVGNEKVEGRYPIHDPQGTNVCTILGNTRICRSDIARDWTDTDTVAEAANERPLGEWNAVELVCRGGDVTVSVNGRVVNRGFDVRPRHGRLQLQSEGCAVEFRNIRLETESVQKEKRE